MNAAFYDKIRPHLNLTTENVAGIEKVTAYALKRGTSLAALAYILATAWWETGQRVQPIKEGGGEKYLRSKKYWPWFGRGLIQTTWKDGYERIAVAMGLPKNTFTNNPELLLTWEHALPAMFVGMEKGIYTTKKLSDYIDDIDESDEEDVREWANARRIVNGTDKAATIANLALIFERGLKAGGWGIQAPPPPPRQPVPTPQPSWLERIINWFRS